ncbi:histone acetyltransferase of the CBP family 1 [Striga asiatica]|uniref:histone acetyltransferase n=1 Tax=Striga asiatica TaxID=4170 RepID=A0A5A7R952_STRAF|nr:histone acetyltransferase of the CBP family 1 [Striga asiatica]
MNLQTHQTGQVSNQANSMLPRLPQQNGNPVSNQMQNPNARHSVPIINQEILQIRRHMQGKIWEFLVQRCRQPQDVANKKLGDLVKRLEDGLFKCATTKEEYMDLSTLEQRLHAIIKRPMSNHSQQLPHANSSPPIGTMIPTPGFQQTGNSSLSGTSSVDSSLAAMNNSNSIASSAVSSGGFVPMRNLSAGSVHCGFSSSDGNLATGYQQSSNAFVSINGGNRMIASMSAQRMTTQMIPTPGINNSNNNDVNMNANNQTFVKVESSTSGGACPTVEPTSSSQIMLQKQNAGSQNSRILHNIGGHMGGGIRSTLQQKSLGLSNRPGIIKQVPGITEGHVTETVCGTSTKPLHQPFDQYQRPRMSGDGIGTSDASVSANMTSVGSMMNNHSLNSGSMQSMPTVSPQMMTSCRSNAYSTQQSATIDYQSTQHPENRSFQPQHLQHPQVLHSSPQSIQHRQVAQNQSQQKNQTQNQLLMKCDSSSQPQAASEVKPLIKTELLDDSQLSNPFHLPGMRNQFQHSSLEELPGASQLLLLPSGHPRQFGANPQHDFTLSDSIKPDESIYQGVLNQVNNRIIGQDLAQPNKLSSEESVIGRPDSSQLGDGISNNINREKQFKNQQRWLLFMRHARRCPAPEGKCSDNNCFTVQKLLKHMENCNMFQCTYPRCRATRVLINHHRRCRDESCPVCVPVKNFVQAQLKQLARSDFNPGMTSSVDVSFDPHDTAEIGGRSTADTSPVIAEVPEELQPPTKRTKLEQGSQFECSVAMNSHHSEQHHDSVPPLRSEIAEVKMEIPGSVGQLNPKDTETIKETKHEVCIHSAEVDPVAPNNPDGVGVQEDVKTENEMDQGKMEITSVQSENAAKSGKPKIKGVSMIELFTPEQVRQHITGLRQWIGQSRAKAERNQAMEHSMNENSCQLCAVEKLTFEPPPIYCTPCGARIKRNAQYYTVGAGETRHCFCIPCYNDSRGDTIMVDGSTIPKSKVERKKNDEETEEWWVQCDKCEAWQHQICALFNGRRNDGGQAEYTCPNCYVEEVERGERMPLPHSAVLGAKDLPRTNLSDHLEQRLFAKLKQERQDRARLQGKNIDEVPGAEALVVVLLFQRIEGVEVCLFGMYVQEFGTDCQQPNHRRVYLSYLDSVKYFRPEIKAVTGEALRTFIGYLEYCKMCGFTSCYIWACPPLKGEDYILYCHPEIQKTPKSDKLREWYLSMLRKASKESVVVELTNLYEHFFVSTGECKAKVTAARLPYFDGDYWPGAAEDIIYQLQQEEDGRKPHKKGIIKKSITKRALKASGQTDLSGNASKDLMLMHKVEITGIPDETKDNEVLESEFFDTRQAFLSLCQGNHYQYDTLRRAKHSSMMVLYHLHNPTAPAFVSTCAVCHLDIEAGQGWRCDTCPDYDVCGACYRKDGGVDHPHPLTSCQSSDHDAQNKEARQLRVTQLRKMLDLLVHASQCRSPLCQYPNCRKVKGLFRHGMGCKTRASGGCPLCKKMWYLLQLHARACKETECTVPRCRDLKDHMRRLQQQSDSRRRAAVNEMMRQRAAEVASNS